MAEARLTYADVPRFMDELKEMAQRLLQREHQAQSLQATGLVLSALRRQKPGGWDKNKFDEVEVAWANREQLLAHCFQAMRHVLIDHGRRRRRKRQLKPVRLTHFNVDSVRRRALENRLEREVLEALAEALETLKNDYPKEAEVIEHRFFAGLTQKDTAEFLEVSERTVRRLENRAVALLFGEMTGC